MSRIKLLLSLMLAVSTILHSHISVAHAQEDNREQSEAERGREIQKQWRVADHEMNTALDSALEAFVLTPKEQKELSELAESDRAGRIAYNKRMRADLRASQRAWLAYRDASCQSVTDFYEDGSGEPIAVASCKLQLTTERTRFLRSFFAIQK